MSYYDDTQIQQYLDVMGGFEAEYPDVGFILMTGHTDGTGPGDTLYRHNDMVRQYARDHNMVLFDFADIETYDPLGGGPYLNNSEGTCTWCEDFCAAHPEYCTDLPDYCAHSDNPSQAALFCKLKGQAFWWLLARIAGWDGVPYGSSRISASIVTPTNGQTVTYTIVVGGLNAPLTATVHVTNVVPAGLVYAANTLTATRGLVTATAPTLLWSGVMSPSGPVTITYAVHVAVPHTQTITSTAIIAVPGYETITRTTTIIANGYSVYLPVVMRNR